ncbi:stage II sporulation protein P [Pseudoneobacillus sp. C159]
MRQSIWKVIYHTILGVLFTFILIGIIIFMNIKIDSKGIHINFGELGQQNVLLNFLRAENHYFYQIMDGEKDLFTISNMTSTIFHLATNIKPTDTRTFLGNELPGLSLFDIEIVVAGEGTTLATLPYESSPPLDVLLKERELVEENIKNTVLDESTQPPFSNSQEKTVFIYQTHSWESYLPYIKNPKSINDAISSDPRVNVVGLGKRLSNNLQKAGIGVEHDQTNMTQALHKRNLDYYDSYSLSGDIVEASANKNKKLEYFIDIHRDSQRKEKTTKTINGKPYARIYFIIGKENKNYEQNQQFAEELNKRLEEKYPGISRGVFLKPKSEGNGVYNQDISNRAILIEVGGVDNNLEELTRTIDAFSDIFTEYYWESKEAIEVNGK